MKRKRIGLRIIAFTIIGIITLLIIWAVNGNRQIKRLETVQAGDIAPGTFFEIDGRQIHIQVIGDLNTDPTGVPLLMLHGFGPIGSAAWIDFAENHLSQGRTLILPDFLGMGYSERVVEPGPYYTIAGQAEMIAAVLEELNIDRVDLIGHSYGGAVSAQFALEHPERIRRMVLLDAQIYENRIGEFFQSLGTLPFGIGRAITWYALGGGSALDAIFCEEATPCPLRDIVLIENTVDTLQAINDTPQVSRLPADLPLISIPVSVIWGTDDQIVPVEDGQQLADTLDTTILLIDGGSHAPFYDAPFETTQIILSAFNEP
jgi:pimeloyl-ACP methyl ester carboxylesterase